MVDFEGSDNRQEIAGWSTFGNTRGLRHRPAGVPGGPVDPQEPGLHRVHRPARPRWAAASTRPRASRSPPAPTIPASRWVTPSPWRCRQIIPDRCSPQTYKYGSPRQMWGDLDPRTGKPFFDHGGETNAGWVNAVKGVDGWGALSSSNGNLIKASAEINETLYPHLLRGRNYITDSGGAGPVAGRVRVAVRQGGAHADLRQPVRRQPVPHPSRDRRGRATAPPTVQPKRRAPTARWSWHPSVAGVLLETGERLVYHFGGGGGWGDPLLRDPAAVLDDVWDEYVSIDGRAARLRRGPDRIARGA